MSSDHRSNLHEALARASVNSSLPIGGAGIGGSRVPALQLEPEDMMTVERFPIAKVTIKVEVASFVDRYFLSRTSNDDTVLAISKENLIEQLTTLFSGLEERASRIEERFPVNKPEKQSRPGNRASSDQAHSNPEKG